MVHLFTNLWSPNETHRKPTIQPHTTSAWNSTQRLPTVSKPQPKVIVRHNFIPLCSLFVPILSAASSVNANKKLPTSQGQTLSQHSFLGCQSIMSLQLFVEIKISQVSLNLNYISIQWHKKAVRKAEKSLYSKWNLQTEHLGELCCPNNPDLFLFWSGIDTTSRFYHLWYLLNVFSNFNPTCHKM